VSLSGAIAFSLLLPVALVILVILVVVVLVGGRDEPDPGGRRPYSAYVLVVTFLALFTILFAMSAMVTSLVHLTVSDDTEEAVSSSSSSDFSVSTDEESTTTEESGPSSDPDDGHIRDAVRAGLLAAAAGAVLAFHLARARELVEEADAGPARRVSMSYLYSATTLAVIVLVVAAVGFGYGVFQVIAPGVASDSGVGKRTTAIPDLAGTAVLAAGAAAIFLAHWRRRPGASTFAAPTPALPPPAPPPAPPEPARPVRRGATAKKVAPRRPRRPE
jgi:hypothetical protein